MGAMSPYPTVVSVTIAQYLETGILVNPDEDAEHPHHAQDADEPQESSAREEETDVGGQRREEVDDAEEAAGVLPRTGRAPESCEVLDREEDRESPLQPSQDHVRLDREFRETVEHHHEHAAEDRDDQRDVERPAQRRVVVEDDPAPAFAHGALLRCVHARKLGRALPADQRPMLVPALRRRHIPRMISLPVRIWLPTLALLLSAPCAVSAQDPVIIVDGRELPRARRAAERLRVIPAPRQVLDADDPIRFRGVITIDQSSDPEDRAAARDFIDAMRERGVRTELGPVARGWHVERHKVGGPAAQDLLASRNLTFDPAMEAEGYVLIADRRGAHLIAASEAGAFYGLQTLKQLFTGQGEQATLQPAVVRDWPAMRWRGVQDDLSRGPVPTLEFQKRQIRTIAAYKLNTFSPYFEHTLEFKSHPLIAPPFGAMSRDDVRELVAYAARYHVMVIPQQQAFGHLHHVLKYELYAPLSETPHGHVLAPGQPGSLELTRAIFAEIDSMFPAPFVHLGADETFELGKGQTKARVDSATIGPVYVEYLRDIERTLRRDGKRFLFWGDIAMNHPALVKSLPKDMIAIGWEYGARTGFDRFLKPFREAGMETWVAPGVSSWNRVWPNFPVALANIQGFAREGQAAGSTGILNTTWDDNGDAIFNQTWLGVVFGAAAGWQSGEADIAAFRRAFGLQFHGDNAGLIDAAHRHLDAAQLALQESRAGDASSYLFFEDPYTDEGVVDLIRLRPVLSRVRIHAESALVLIEIGRAHV